MEFLVASAGAAKVEARRRVRVRTQVEMRRTMLICES
jgi:hypothetical protein